ncbi:restriction endonuclease subunit S [Mycobacterium sp. pW045]|uniref:restriction endonuclease subunit S n=1 Tax=Mycobacterium sp. pW045 TaxID=3238984 RepID=UPI00351B1F6C
MTWPTHRVCRDSEVSWLGNVPNGWQIDRLKYAFKRIQRSYSADAETVTAFRDGVVTARSNRRTDGFTEADKYIGYQGIEPGDLAIHAMDGFAGAIGVSDSSGKCSPVVSVCQPEAGIDPHYYAHILRHVARSGYLTSIAKGIRERSTDFRWADARELMVPFPSEVEQQAIVSFLDRETAKIDVLVAKQEQLIATLREDRTATITHAVTKGLDPDVEMAPSGDTTLPASPLHWKRRVPLKHVASVQTGITLGKSVDPSEAVSLPYLRVANVQAGAVNLDEVKAVEVRQAEVGNYLLRAGDVLMTEGGDIDKLGRGCLWTGEIAPCIHQNHVFAVRCTDDLDGSFLVYLLDTAVARNYFFMTAKKTTNLASTNSTTLGRFYFSLPPRGEQREIVNFLDERCGRIDALIAKANEMINTLREYRSALITDAVTGKIDVRGAA